MTFPQDKYSPLYLAYVGDAVFELLMREKAVESGKKMRIQQLHRYVTEYVRARGQSNILDTLEDHLTAEEADVVRRGRNVKGRVPKSASIAAYRRATGLEALFGYLYLAGREKRIRNLFALIDFGEGEE